MPSRLGYTGLALLRPTVLAIALASLTPSAHAVIVTGGSPMPRPENGYVGQWNGSSCVAVGPNWFLSAKHVGGGVGQPVLMRGVFYQVLEVRQHPTYDVQILRVAEQLPGFHKLADLPSVGDPVYLGGYGVTAAGPLPNNGGWDWNGIRTEAWGANVIEGDGSLLAIRFDSPGSTPSVPNEAVFAVNDSGAGMFTIAADGSLQLVGIAVSVLNFGSAPWNTVAFALNVNLYRSWLQPVVDPAVPLSSGVAAPRAALGLPAGGPISGGLLLALSLATVRRRR